MRTQYQIRKDAEFVLLLANKGKIQMSTGEVAYLDQSIKLYDFALETGEMTPKFARKYLRNAVKNVTGQQRREVQA